MRAIATPPVSPTAAAVRWSFRNPLLAASMFALAWHAVRFGAHFASGLPAAQFFFAPGLAHFVWLPEFLVPWVSLMALRRLGARHSEQVRREVESGLEQGHQIQRVSIIGFAKIAEARDGDTGNHILRMSHYSRILAEEMGKLPEYSGYITGAYCEDLFISAPLHDIGKVGIRDSILLKAGRLTPDEFEMMKLHTIIGGDLLYELELKLKFRTFYSLSKEIAYHHHQRFDGGGYPNVLGPSKAMFVEQGIGRPLKGKEIPLSARIVALADVYDALTSRRCYKEAFPHEKAREMILRESGRHFDPDVVDSFVRRERELLGISRQFSN